MTQEDKDLLLKDLCARLPYGVYVEHTTTEIRGRLKGIVFEHIYNDTDSIQDINAWAMFFGDEYVDATYFRPFLRPMSSMTEDEKREIYDWLVENDVDWFDFSKLRLHEILISFDSSWLLINWLNAHHFDYHGLIEKGLALEAPEDMYKTE